MARPPAADQGLAPELAWDRWGLDLPPGAGRKPVLGPVHQVGPVRQVGPVVQQRVRAAAWAGLVGRPPPRMPLQRPDSVANVLPRQSNPGNRSFRLHRRSPQRRLLRLAEARQRAGSPVRRV